MTLRILGIDPGLTHTGIGVIDFNGFKSTAVYYGTISSTTSLPVYDRLAKIHNGLSNIIRTYSPNEVAIEEVFVNSNPKSSLTLGLARGVALCVPALFDLKVFEYTPNSVKKTVVGSGHADKSQISHMVQMLLSCEAVSKDASDALAIAICHAHHYIGGKLVGAVK